MQCLTQEAQENSCSGQTKVSFLDIRRGSGQSLIPIPMSSIVLNPVLSESPQCVMTTPVPYHEPISRTQPRFAFARIKRDLCLVQGLSQSATRRVKEYIDVIDSFHSQLHLKFVPKPRSLRIPTRIYQHLPMVSRGNPTSR